MIKSVKQNFKNYGGNNIISIDYRLFNIITLISCLYLFVNPGLKIFGAISIIIIFLLCVINVFNCRFKIQINQIWLWFSIFLAYNIIMITRNPTTFSLYSGILQIMLLFLATSYTSVSLSKQAIQGIFRYGKIIFLLLLIPVSVLIYKGGDSAIRTFDNYFSFTIYKIMLPCSFFFIAKSRKKLINIFLISLIFFAIGERTSFACMYIIYFVYLFLNKIKKSKSAYKLFFIISAICIVFIPFVYVGLQYNYIGSWLNKIMWKYTGANFFSGRNIIWEIALNYFSESPLFGYGIGNSVLVDNGINWSTHNLYLYLLLQGGIIGLFIFLKYMYSIWMFLFDELDDSIVCMSAAYLIGFMFFVSFELALIINAINISFYLWLVVAIGFIHKNRNRSLS